MVVVVVIGCTSKLFVAVKGGLSIAGIAMLENEELPNGAGVHGCR